MGVRRPTSHCGFSACASRRSAEGHFQSQEDVFVPGVEVDEPSPTPCWPVDEFLIVKSEMLQAGPYLSLRSLNARVIPHTRTCRHDSWPTNAKTGMCDQAGGHFI